MAASFEGQQINRPHIAQACSRSQNCNVTINLESNGHTRPTQEPIPPDVSYGTLIFIFSPPPRLPLLPPSDKYIHMLGVKSRSGAVWIHDLVMGDSQFDEVRLRLHLLAGLLLSRTDIYQTSDPVWVRRCWAEISREASNTCRIKHFIFLHGQLVNVVLFVSNYASTGIPRFGNII